MTTKKFDSDHDERGLLPLPGNHSRNQRRPGRNENCVAATTTGDMLTLSVRKMRDERGNTYFGIDRGHTRPSAVKADAGCLGLHRFDVTPLPMFPFP